MQNNKNLQELFNLPDTDESTTFTDLAEPPPGHSPDEITLEAANNLDKINNALPQVTSLEADDKDMDALSDLAKGSYQDLVDLGMQVDSRSAGDILHVAQQFLGHAITAKTAKMNKKLKMIDLQLKKAKLDADKLKHNPEQVQEAEGTVMDRNELLDELLKRQKEQES